LFIFVNGWSGVASIRAVNWLSGIARIGPIFEV
jgi:hypothetical protein